MEKLHKIKIDNVTYDIGGGASVSVKDNQALVINNSDTDTSEIANTIAANPSAEATEALNKIKIGDVVYVIESSQPSSDNGQETIDITTWCTEMAEDYAKGVVPEEYRDIERLKKALLSATLGEHVYIFRFNRSFQNHSYVFINDIQEDFNMYTTIHNDTWKITVYSTTYQQKLVSGTNIKTINNESILGSGNIEIEGSGSVGFTDLEVSDACTKVFLSETVSVEAYNNTVNLITTSGIEGEMMIYSFLSNPDTNNNIEEAGPTNMLLLVNTPELGIILQCMSTKPGETANVMYQYCLMLDETTNTYYWQDLVTQSKATIYEMSLYGTSITSIDYPEDNIHIDIGNLNDELTDIFVLEETEAVQTGTLTNNGVTTYPKVLLDNIYSNATTKANLVKASELNKISSELTSINQQLVDKQDKLTAGKNITINNNVISTPDVPPILNAVPETLTSATPKFFMVGDQLYIRTFAGYLTFSSDDAFELTVTEESSNDGSLEYSTDTATWTEVTKGTAISSVNNKIYLRGSGNTYVKSDDNSVFYFSGSNIKCDGNIETLLDYQTVLNGGHPVMAEYCFSYMFANCTNLTQAPDLPATTLADYCYYYMFYHCTGLTTAPELPATTLASDCYNGMFCYCTSLTQAPALPTTTLAESCYSGMFSGCTGLTTAPILPATTLAESCYSGMFSGCTGLTTAPELPATTLADYCFSYMFSNCTSLTQAPALPATTLADRCYYDMFSGCTGLTQAPELPATTLADRCYEHMFYGCTGLTQAPALPATTLADRCYEGMFSDCTNLTQAPALPATTLADYCYYDMFKYCTNLTTAPELPATTLDGYCYANMFYHCRNLTQAPELPATILADYCYSSMFNGCRSLTQAPELPATTLADYCYNGMFYYCTSLTQAPELPATTLASDCYNGMFYNCTSLTQAPALPATTLTDRCYGGMFQGCTGLTTAPALPATTLAGRCYESMFSGCTGLTQAPALPATTLDGYCYANMFANCTNLTTAPELPATTLANDCYRDMFYYCTSLITAPALPATTLAIDCYYQMFYYCTNIKLSTTQSDEYPNAYRIPSGTATGTTATDALTNMFLSTGGTFTGTPTINRTYYTSNEIV